MYFMRRALCLLGFVKPFNSLCMNNIQSKPHASTFSLHLPRLYLGLWISCFSMVVVVERKKQIRKKQSLWALTRICTKLKMLKKVFVREQASPGEPVNSEIMGTIHDLEYCSWSVTRPDKTLPMEIIYRTVSPWKLTLEHTYNTI